MKESGFTLVIISIIMWFFSVTMETSVLSSGYSAERIYNTGLMQKQMLYVYTAGILFLSGIILIGLGYAHDSLYGIVDSIDDKIPDLEESEPQKLEESNALSIKKEFKSYKQNKQ
jgi:hypothetical protein